ncbi:MAG: tyrosinase family protein [Pseudomonadota bacterium]
MAYSDELRVRHSVRYLQDAYESGDKKPLEDLMRAWKGIKELPADNPNSFFMIGGYHGEPFAGAGWGNASYWGGYCNHGNVLFPTWHRAYVLRLENALRSIPGCEQVTQPFWDETSDASAAEGIPWALTAETFNLDGETIPNPLRSFVLNRAIVDHLSPIPDADYSKPLGYETVRYPLSGLVGPKDIEATKAHNAKFPDHATNVQILNQNVIAWLTSHIVVDGKVIPTNVRQKYADCLNAPNYTAFSNTTSAAEWNDHASAADRVVPLENPHNSVHLAVGGYDVPGQGDFSPIPGANGDMGENDTAGLDPIFFFHHCHVDRMFWLWQKRHGTTDDFDIIPGFPGSNSVDSQGPTPGVGPNSWLTMDSPLDPFVTDERPTISRDCINIETQMGYTYGPGSLEDAAPMAEAVDTRPAKIVEVGGINRAATAGSFLITAYGNVDGKRVPLGHEAILSRWHVQGCVNCQTHLEARAHIGVDAATFERVGEAGIDVQVHTRAPDLKSVGLMAEAAGEPAPTFSVKIRD